LGHCTRITSANSSNIFPDRDRVFTRQILSINTILVFVKHRTLIINPTMQIGMHVPGPLHIMSSGRFPNITGKEARKENRVVNTDVIYD
jgi:hypothetical protein